MRLLTWWENKKLRAYDRFDKKQIILAGERIKKLGFKTEELNWSLK